MTLHQTLIVHIRESHKKCSTSWSSFNIWGSRTRWLLGSQGGLLRGDREGKIPPKFLSLFSCSNLFLKKQLNFRNFVKWQQLSFENQVILTSRIENRGALPVGSTQSSDGRRCCSGHQITTSSQQNDPRCRPWSTVQPISLHSTKKP